MPPRLIRDKLSSSASAIDWPRLVLPTPGGPRKQRIAPALRIQFPYRQIFDQPLLNFFQIVMIPVQDLLRLIEVQIVLLNLFHGSRQLSRYSLR